MTISVRRAARIATFVALPLVALLPAPAQAAPAWLPAPFSVAPSGGNQLRDVAFTPGGEAIAVWTTNAGGDLTVRAGVRPVGGRFPAGDSAQELSGAVNDVPDVRVVALPNGGAVATWAQGDGSEANVVRASVRPPGGRFGDAVSLSGVGQIDAPDIDVAANGAVGVTWAESIGSADRVRLAVRQPGGAFPDPPGALSLAPASEGPSDAHVGVGPSGRTVVTWTDSSDESGTVIRMADGSLSGTFTGARNVTPSPAADTPREGVQALQPEVDLDAAGTATIAWQVQGESTATLDGSAVESRSLSAAGDFTSAEIQRLSPTSEDADPPAVGVSDQGEAVVTWSDAGDPARIRVATGPSVGPLTLVDPLSQGSEDGTTPWVAFDPEGNSIVAWQAGIPGVTGFPSRVEAARRPAGGTFSAPATLSETPPTSAPSVALDSEGNGFVAWTQGSFSARRIDGAGYDNAPPRVRAVRSPGALRPNTSFSFSVTADDVWAASPTVTWDFGDGTTASGSPVDHAYASPGTYQGVVSVTDTVGNVASRSFTVVVDPAAPDAPAPPVTPNEPEAPGAPQAGDSRAPSLRGLSATPSRFQVGQSRTPLVGSALASGTRLRFRSSERGVARIVFLRRSAGRRAGGRCVPAPPSQTRRRCVVLRRVGHLVRRVSSGVSVIRFSGRLGARALAPGHYQVRLTVTDRAGNRSAPRGTLIVVVAADRGDDGRERRGGRETDPRFTG